MFSIKPRSRLRRLHYTISSEPPTVEPRGTYSQRDEELASVRIRPTIRHTQHSSTRVFQRRVYLVSEAVAVYGLSAASCARWIPGLEHEVWDDAVEDYTVVVAALREGGEVFACLGEG